MHVPVAVYVPVLHARAPKLRWLPPLPPAPSRPLPAECCSLFPSRSYVLAEADTAPSGTAVANGYYFVSEVGYNPISNSFGASTSQVGTGRRSGPQDAAQGRVPV